MIWLVLTAAGIILLLLLSALRALLVGEILGWLPSFERALLCLAATRVPSEFRERYREEWGGELEQLFDRPISALAYAIQVYMRASAVGCALGARPEAGHAVTAGSTEGAISVATAIARTEFRRGAGWEKAVDSMRRDLPALASEIDAPLDAASERFAALLAPAPLPALYALARTQLKLSPRETVKPLPVDASPVDTSSAEAQPRSRLVPSQSRRNGPYGCIDLEAEIAPLTPRERRAAEPYWFELVGQREPLLTAAWPAAVRQALVVAVQLYDSRAARHDARLSPTGFRLSAFLAIWDTGPVNLGVRRLPGRPEH